MGTVNRNVATLRGHLQLKQSAFAERIGADQSYISKWERDVEPGPRYLAKMAEMAGTSVDRFMDQEWTPPAAKNGPDIPPTRIADAGEAVGILQLDLSVAMGPGTEIEDFVESDTVSFDLSVLRRLTRTPPARLRFVTGIGNSHDPKFQHNDQFLIDINDRMLSRLDGYYWITVHGAHALKRLRPIGGGRIQVISENPSFDPQEVDAEDLRIEGRAIWVARGL
jgi:phage repressor protein C with HTH and peptisase S24 domain